MICSACQTRSTDGCHKKCWQCRVAAKKAEQSPDYFEITEDWNCDVACSSPPPVITQPAAPLPADAEHGRGALSTSSGNGLILVLPDLHAPNHDRAAFSAILSLLEHEKFAEIVLLGDVGEFVSVSWFGGPKSLKSYKEESLEVREVLCEIRNRHSGRMTWTKGNHCMRAEQAIEKSKPQLSGCIKDEIGCDELGIELVEENEQPIERGRLRMLHGHQDLGGKFPPKYHSARMVDRYGLPGVSVVYGHVHVPQMCTRAMHGGPASAFCLGCLERRPDWLKGVSAWCLQFAVADPVSGAVQPITIVDGGFWYGGRHYGSQS